MSSDVRRLTVKQLLEAAAHCYAQLDPNRTVVSSCAACGHQEALDELFRRLKIMREFCEATSELGDGIHPHTAYMDGKRRWYLALDAYRAMKEKK